MKTSTAVLALLGLAGVAMSAKVPSLKQRLAERSNSLAQLRQEDDGGDGGDGGEEDPLDSSGTDNATTEK